MKMFVLTAFTFKWAIFLLISFQSVISHESDDENIAMGKPAYQSSDMYPGRKFGSPESAVDGNLGSYFKRDRSCSNTRKEHQAWWVVDLGATYRVSIVEVTNRGDCCADRLSNFDILIGTQFNRECLSTFKSIATVPGVLAASETRLINTSTVYEGRYVMVRLNGEGILTLCEVEIHGEPAENFNIAKYRPATQISNQYEDGRGTADKAVDGNNGVHFHHDNTCTHTKKHSTAWWQVDLGQEYSITSISITNRADCCFNRLRDFNVMIGDGLEYELIERVRDVIGAGVTKSIDAGCKAYVGRFLKIQLNRMGVLSLCEVAVFGRKV